MPTCIVPKPFDKRAHRYTRMKPGCRIRVLDVSWQGACKTDQVWEARVSASTDEAPYARSLLPRWPASLRSFWLSRRNAQGHRAPRYSGCPATRAARLALALQPNCAWYQREKALGAEKPSSIATSVNERSLSTT